MVPSIYPLNLTTKNINTSILAKMFGALDGTAVSLTNEAEKGLHEHPFSGSFCAK
jgi:hypothetical protein